MKFLIFWFFKTFLINFQIKGKVVKNEEIDNSNIIGEDSGAIHFSG